jgi:hypothetical protein
MTSIMRATCWLVGVFSRRARDRFWEEYVVWWNLRDLRRQLDRRRQRAAARNT